jgi:hypothetical protein
LQQARATAKKTPVAVISAMTGPEIINKVKALGADGPARTFIGVSTQSGHRRLSSRYRHWPPSQKHALVAGSAMLALTLFAQAQMADKNIVENAVATSVHTTLVAIADLAASNGVIHATKPCRCQNNYFDPAIKGLKCFDSFKPCF